MAKRTGLGKGLGSLISESALEAHIESGEEESQKAESGAQKNTLPLDVIHPNIHQPRTIFDEDKLNELAESIKAVGILQPIIVRPDGDDYEIVAGERRYQAAQRAGLTEIPVIIRDVNSNETLELALIENIQRSNLNVVEEARAYKEIITRTGITQIELARRLSKSRSAIANTLRLLDLPDEVQDMLFDGRLTAGHARSLLSVDNRETQIALAQKVIEEQLSVRETEDLVSKTIARTTEDDDTTNEPKRRSTIPRGFKRISDDLSTMLNTGVKIKRNKDAYKIEIEFDNEDDLNRIINSFIR